MTTIILGMDFQFNRFSAAFERTTQWDIYSAVIIILANNYLLFGLQIVSTDSS